MVFLFQALQKWSARLSAELFADSGPIHVTANQKWPDYGKWFTNRKLSCSAVGIAISQSVPFVKMDVQRYGARFLRTRKTSHSGLVKLRMQTETKACYKNGRRVEKEGRAQNQLRNAKVSPHSRYWPGTRRGNFYIASNPNHLKNCYRQKLIMRSYIDVGRTWSGSRMRKMRRMKCEA